MINIIAPIFGISGYDVHARNLANALNKLTKVRLSTQIMPGIEKIITDQELEMVKRKPEKDEIKKRLDYFKFVYHDKFFSIETKTTKTKDIIKKTKVITGQSANPGRVIGRARIIRESLQGVSLS